MVKGLTSHKRNYSLQHVHRQILKYRYKCHHCQSSCYAIVLAACFPPNMFVCSTWRTYASALLDDSEQYQQVSKGHLQYQQVLKSHLQYRQVSKSHLQYQQVSKKPPAIPIGVQEPPPIPTGVQRATCKAQCTSEIWACSGHKYCRLSTSTGVD